MKISEKEVKHVAHLSRLNLEESELVKMTEQLDNILSYVDKLSELNTEGVVPTTHAFSKTNAFREDIVKDSLSQEKSLVNGPLQNGTAFQVPRVL
ncbi:MAG: Asp-tRNA(Asn)/Glu-tRNA(Gln) amidotransferase subunit GatC [Desulfotalea sp.]